jgi:SAM-dependent methyltransferase
MTACRICGNETGNRSYTAREMMFGYRDEFRYFECADCGCLQITEIPQDLEKYYPASYYSFGRAADTRLDPVSSLIRRARARYCLLGSNRLWGLKSKHYGSYDWFKKSNAGFDSRILDVGCGTGKRLIEMRKDGFTDLTGQDPFISETVYYENGVKVIKGELSEMEGAYDLIMLHHSFEHMADPLAVMKELHRLLAPGGYVLIRVPLASHAWRHYGIDWVGVDAPRHFYLHTVRSMNVLADQAGFVVRDTTFDSGALQFWASELIKKDVPLMEETEDGVRSRKTTFSKAEMRAFKKRAEGLNRNGEGDAACFYLQKRGDLAGDQGSGS